MPIPQSCSITCEVIKLPQHGRRNRAQVLIIVLKIVLKISKPYSVM